MEQAHQPYQRTDSCTVAAHTPGTSHCAKFTQFVSDEVAQRLMETYHMLRSNMDNHQTFYNCLHKEEGPAQESGMLTRTKTSLD